MGRGGGRVHERACHAAPLCLPPLLQGLWKGVGVLGPECFDPLPFMERMAGYGFPWGIMDVKPREGAAAAAAAAST